MEFCSRCGFVAIFTKLHFSLRENGERSGTVETGHAKNAAILIAPFTSLLHNEYYFAVASKPRVNFGFGTFANENMSNRKMRDGHETRGNKDSRFNHI